MSSGDDLLDMVLRRIRRVLIGSPGRVRLVGMLTQDEHGQDRDSNAHVTLLPPAGLPVVDYDGAAPC
jgi:hypothetical protein